MKIAELVSKVWPFAPRALALEAWVSLVAWNVRDDHGKSMSAWLGADRSTLYGSLASLFGSLLGFTITALSIIIAVSGSRAVSRLKKADQFEALWMVFTRAILFLGASTAASLVGLVVDSRGHHLFAFRAVALLLYLFSGSELFMCVMALHKIGKTIGKSGHSNVPNEIDLTT